LNLNVLQNFLPENFTFSIIIIINLIIIIIVVVVIIIKFV